MAQAKRIYAETPFSGIPERGMYRPDDCPFGDQGRCPIHEKGLPQVKARLSTPKMAADLWTCGPDLSIMGHFWLKVALEPKLKIRKCSVEPMSRDSSVERYAEHIAEFGWASSTDSESGLPDIVNSQQRNSSLVNNTMATAWPRPLPHWGGADVISDLNLQCFMGWFARAPAAEARAVSELFTTQHYSAPTWLSCLAQRVEPEVSNKEDPSVVWRNVSQPCRDRECPRCLQGRGGWAFRWVSPASSGGWTPTLAIASNHPPEGNNKWAYTKRCAGATWPVGTKHMPTVRPDA